MANPSTSLKVCSWNVGGIHSPIKRKKILNYLKKENIHVALLQETHLTSDEHLKLKRDWVGQVFYSSFTSRSRGVAILIHKHLPLTNTQSVCDKSGRYLLLKGTLHSKPISFLNVYFPPVQSLDLITLAFSSFSDWICDNTVIAGDFNCYFSSSMDKSLATQVPTSKRAKALLDTCAELELVDTWRVLHPKDKEFTFFSGVHKTSSRIDFVFTPKVSLGNIVNCRIGDIIISDHAPVFVELDNLNANFRNYNWRFNNFLIHDPKFEKFLNDHLNNFIQDNKTPDVSPGLLWDTLKAYTRGLVISYSAGLKKRTQMEQRKLELKLHELQIKHNLSPSEQLRGEIHVTKTALEGLLTKKAEKSIFFMKQRLYEFANKPNRYLANILKNKGSSRNIPCIKDALGILNCDNIVINDTFKTFYKQLYTSQFKSSNYQDMSSFFQNLDLPQITEIQKEELSKPITRSEILKIIQRLPNNKAPGPDGFNGEFYKKFSQILLSPLSEMVDSSFASGALPPSLLEANISLVLKKDKPPEECSSYRPISVLNIDLKILAKTLASRLETILPSIIHNDQTGFIRGRYSTHNVRRLLNLIQHSSAFNSDSMIISLDAEKAFDRLEWPYLFFTLQKFGMTDGFINWIRILYASPLSAVITNGHKSNNFSIERGSRQGCPLSPLLFALAMEPLAAAIRMDPCIEGLLLNNCQRRISLYADDVLIFLNSPSRSIPKLINLITQYSSFSGYKIYFSKSEAMPLSSSYKASPSISRPFRWSPNGFTYLGFKISPNLKDLYNLNYTPLIQAVNRDLDRWCSLPLSLLGRIHLVKMNILPRLLYLFQMLPLVLSSRVLAKLNSSIVSFIWNRKRPRLRYSYLSLPIRMGGLAAPSLPLYLWSAQFKFLLEWYRSDQGSIYLSAESASLNDIPLWNLLYISPPKSSLLAKDNLLLKNMLSICHKVRSLEGYKKHFSLLTPIHQNPDFIPGLNAGFSEWFRGIKTVGDLVDGDAILSFQQVKDKYGISSGDVFRYMQVKHFILGRLKECDGQMSISQMESLILKTTKLKSFSKSV
uniref:Reverse transcriptase domain-containing protein n=1 Tax=Amphiprion ocellaris TaxID=80972 RepID=A0AAQ6AKY8_AMPOC